MANTWTRVAAYRAHRAWRTFPLLLCAARRPPLTPFSINGYSPPVNPAQSDVATAIRQLEAGGATRLVLDLRDNRGGLVTEGLEVARLFLDGEEPAGGGR
mgnify:CR=1 FL=1